MPKMAVLVLLAAAALTACSSGPEPTPAPGDRLSVEIDTIETLQLESYPVQLMLHVEGWLPNPCAEPEWEVSRPEGLDGPIVVELYAVADPEEICIQVLEPFEVNIPLGQQPDGRVVIVVNGETLPTQ